jgi:hypothetical protein
MHVAGILSVTENPENKNQRRSSEGHQGDIRESREKSSGTTLLHLVSSLSTEYRRFSIKYFSTPMT